MGLVPSRKYFLGDSVAFNLESDSSSQHSVEVLGRVPLKLRTVRFPYLCPPFPEIRRGWSLE
jgi:hypothetical protein